MSIENETSEFIAPYLKSICAAILSIPFAIPVIPLFPGDNAAFYFLFVSIAFVLYSCVSLIRAGRYQKSG